MAHGKGKRRAAVLIAVAIGAAAVVGVRSALSVGRDAAPRDRVVGAGSGVDDSRASGSVPESLPSVASATTHAPEEIGAWCASDRTRVDALPVSEFFDLPYEEGKPHRWKAKNWYCVGDFNRDDRVEPSDAVLYLEVFAWREGPYARYLDVNEDGWVDLDDLTLFLRESQSPCDPVERAGTMLLRC